MYSDLHHQTQRRYSLRHYLPPFDVANPAYLNQRESQQTYSDLHHQMQRRYSLRHYPPPFDVTNLAYLNQQQAQTIQEAVIAKVSNRSLHASNLLTHLFQQTALQ